jgi:hypothetical protein
VAEVHLRLTGAMQQRHKHLLVFLRQLPHRVFHHGVTARETILPQPFPEWQNVNEGRLLLGESNQLEGT